LKKLELYRKNNQYIFHETNEHGCVMQQSFSTLSELKEYLDFNYYFELNQCEIVTIYDDEIESFILDFFGGWYFAKRTHWWFAKNLEDLNVKRLFKVKEE